MEGSKHISDLITDPAAILPGRINIIEANVSAGKTHFALNTIPAWAGSPERILYLIDTNNGEYRMLENVLTISRQTYAFCECPSVEAKDAAIAHGLGLNSGFIDGNKRVGVAVMLLIFRKNDVQLSYTQQVLIRLGLDIASNRVNPRCIIAWIKAHNR